MIAVKAIIRNRKWALAFSQLLSLVFSAHFNSMNACGRKNAKTRPRILFSSAYNIIEYLRSDQQLHPPLLAHLACSVINLQDFHVSNLLPVTLSIHLSVFSTFRAKNKVRRKMCYFAYYIFQPF